MCVCVRERERESNVILIGSDCNMRWEVLPLWLRHSKQPAKYAIAAGQVYDD